MNVFITREIPEIAFKLLRKNKIPFDYYKGDKPIPRKLLLKKVGDCDALISLLTEKIDKELIDAMTKCKIIANYAVGYNNIDIKYAKKKNIIVTNTPDVLTESTADLTMTLALSCARRIVEGEKLLRSGKFKGWKPKLLLGTELKNKTFGIIGAGRIGSAVAIRARSFETNIIYFDCKRNVSLERRTGAKKVSLKKLLVSADFISIHLPLNDKNYHFINKDRLKLIKKNAIIINTSRGEIIDETALIQRLKNNKLFAVKNVINVLKRKPPLTPVF